MILYVHGSKNGHFGPDSPCPKNSANLGTSLLPIFSDCNIFYHIFMVEN